MTTQDVYRILIEECMKEMYGPLPKPCGKTKGCRLAGGCMECFAEVIKPKRVRAE